LMGCTHSIPSYWPLLDHLLIYPCSNTTPSHPTTNPLTFCHPPPPLCPTQPPVKGSEPSVLLLILAFCQ
jgi:hypothetical protein